jgi:putative nucleotidyltransferase with HDIG domain
MIKILFVDDEASLLSGLRRMLYGMRSEWDMRFAEGASKALEMLAEAPADVVVSDLRMPGMDGSELLSRVRAEHPETVRIILSGYSELATMLRSLPVAHRMLSKPTEPSDLRAAIARACELQRRLRRPELRQIVGGIDALPSMPSTIQELNRRLSEREPTLDDISNVIKDDVAMTAKLLQLANSALVDLPQTVANVSDAVKYLGLGMVRDLVVVAEIFQAWIPPGQVSSDTLADTEAHAVEVGTIASRIATDEQLSRDSYAAGLLHDVGHLVVRAFMPEQHQQIMERVGESGQTLSDLETEIIGATHADIGAYLLDLWGLPYSIVEAVARHHDAPSISERKLDTVHTVYIAQALAASNSNRHSPNSVTDEYLTELGILQRVQEVGRRAKV